VQTWPIGEEIRYDGTVHPLVAALPYYHEVPKGPVEHLEYRLYVADRCLTDLDFRQGCIDACTVDPLFFCNTFVYIVEAREGEKVSGRVPFNTWAHQDPWLAALSHYSGRRDIKGDKSRAQGESWLLVTDYFREFLFLKNVFQGLVSLDENTADNPDNPDSLGWKIDFIHANLPTWMQVPGLALDGPNRKVTKHTWRNPLRNNYMQAWAATGTAAKGGRRKRVGFDEAAFMADAKALIENLRAVTNCRNVFSTPNGRGDYFCELMHRKDSWLTLPLDWEDNPSQNEGKYTSKGGNLLILDVYPPNYNFRLDDITRSPWFDAECDRAGNNMTEINRELRRDYGGAKSRPFPEEILAPVRKFVRPPDGVGKLSFERSDPSDIDSIEFVRHSKGPLKLWCHLDEEGLPPPGAYVLGCDVAAGTGGRASSSAIQVFNGIGEQVAEFACNKTSPAKLANLAVAMCYWFGHGKPTPFLNWEKTGTLGTQFSRQVERLNYPYIYYMKDPETKGAKRSKKPGWHTSKTASTLEPLANALTNEQIVLRSDELLRECGEYEFIGTDWKHPGGETDEDPANQGVNHGDRACAAGVAVISLRDRHLLPEIRRKKNEREPRLSEAPSHSMAGRFRERKRQDRQRNESVSCVW
jgi:hypothetical protein